MHGITPLRTFSIMISNPKWEDFNSLLKYTVDDFTPIGNLCYINENGQMLPTTTLQEFYNLRWYILLEGVVTTRRTLTDRRCVREYVRMS